MRNYLLPLFLSGCVLAGYAASPGKRAEGGANGLVLFENFEAWDGQDKEWTPAGWSVESHADAPRTDSWVPAGAYYTVTPADGNALYSISYSLENNSQDEWLISPAVDVKEDMILSFYLYMNPVFLFSTDNIDWDSGAYIGDKVVVATLQIWAKAEGEEWTMLHDYADDYKDDSYFDLSYKAPAGLVKKTLSLASVAGKKAQIAFRYVGQDGDIMLIDAVGIGYPSLDGIVYMEPLSTLYWGMDGSVKLSAFSIPVAQQPVFAPVTWTNYTDDDATFQWSYTDPFSKAEATSDDQYELTLTYQPDYSSESTMRNNFYAPPVLTATAPHASPGSYSSPYKYLQAGGRPELVGQDSEGGTVNLDYDLLPFAVQNTGLMYTTVDDDEIGDMALPVFGYNVNADRYWLNYSLNGAEANENDYSHLEAIGNLFIPSEAPLVVNGVNVYGYGSVGDDVEFKATIYGLNAMMEKDFSTMEVMGEATLKGAEADKEGYTTNGYLVFNFKFDEPVVLQATEEHPAYLIFFEGFHNEKVTYFAPLQSLNPDPFGICLGMISHHINMESHTGASDYRNIKYMVYKENGEYVDPTGAFAIGLVAEYPWLTTDSEGVELSGDKLSEQVALGSYYDGSLLSVEAPEGVTATVAGRYDKCVLTVEHADPTSDVEGAVTVKGPGVECSVPVKAVKSSAADIISSEAGNVVGVYDICGRRVADTSASGIYVVKYSDGKSRKIIKKPL